MPLLIITGEGLELQAETARVLYNGEDSAWDVHVDTAYAGPRKVFSSSRQRDAEHVADAVNQTGPGQILDLSRMEITPEGPMIPMERAEEAAARA